MFADIIQIIGSSLSSCFSWFMSLFENTGMIPLLLAVFTIGAIYRFILAPLFSRGSDGSNAKKDGD